MKKIFITSIAVICLTSWMKIQAQASPDFDKKFRFGLRVAPQPTWFKSGDKNNTPAGANFGFGFGLNMEYKLSEIAAVLTGIGGDFEGGKYTFKYDKANNYEVTYWLDENNELVKPKPGSKKDNTAYILKDRRVKSTFVTLPAILKLSTKEYSGFKYFGMFGVELAYRVKALANETYYEIRKYTTDTTFTSVSSAESTESGININSDASLVPLRLGFNVGAGAEYRLAGSTSLFVNINYFTSFTNFLRKESDYMYYRTDRVNGADSYKFVKQNLKLNAVRINIGIMF